MPSNDNPADWMPSGLYTMVSGSNSWGPDLNDVRLALFDNGAEHLKKHSNDERKTFTVAFEKLLEFLPEYGSYEPHFPRLYREPQWNNLDEVRHHLLSVAEILTTRDYSWANHHLPYLWPDADGQDVRGIDCSNFTTLVYNYSLGYRFSSARTEQAGQTYEKSGENLTFDTPNQQSSDTRGAQPAAAGRLVRFDGSVDDGTDGEPFLSVFDYPGEYIRPVSQEELAGALKPGDLLYFASRPHWEAELQKVLHAAIWAGKKIDGDWALIHSTGPGPHIGSVANYLDRVWGVRRVIHEGAAPRDFLNSTYGIPSESATIIRRSSYSEAFEVTRNGTPYIFRVDGNSILRREAHQGVSEEVTWISQTTDGGFNGVVAKWGWLFASDVRTVYKLSYASNSGEWAQGKPLWSSATGTIKTLWHDDDALVVTLENGATKRLNLSGEEM